MKKRPSELMIKAPSCDLTAECSQRQTDFLLVAQDSLAPPLSELRPLGAGMTHCTFTPAGQRVNQAARSQHSFYSTRQ